jgi:hypothetical protein
VKPLEVILALRNLSFGKDSCPDTLKSVRDNVYAKGLVGAVTQRIQDLRQKLQLPKVPEGDDLDLESLKGNA